VAHGRTSAVVQPSQGSGSAPLPAILPLRRQDPQQSEKTTTAKIYKNTGNSGLIHRLGGLGIKGEEFQRIGLALSPQS